MSYIDYIDFISLYTNVPIQSGLV